MIKVAVACPHCGHMTHVDLPTQKIGQICGVCGVGYIYPWNGKLKLTKKNKIYPRRPHLLGPAGPPGAVIPANNP